MGGKKINARAVVAPADFAFVVVAAGELHGLRKVIESGRDVDHPDVVVTLGIEKSFIVAAVDGTADDVDVGFVVVLGPGLRAGLCLGFCARGLFQILGSSGAGKSDAFAIGRPHGSSRTFRQIGDHAASSFSPPRTKARRLPSGDQRGCASCLPLVMRTGASLPEVETIQIEVS